MAEGLDRLGIFGGTFDPPHLGHLILAETVADALDLERVLFVPAGQPPLKEDWVITPVEHRLAMVKAAIAGNRRFAISRADIDRPGPHYSVDMVRIIAAEYPGTELFFMIGSDSLRDLPRWHNPGELIKLCTLAVVRRPSAEPDMDALELAIPGIKSRVWFVDAPLIQIAGRELRRRVREGLSIRYRVTDAVLEYITRHGLYK